MAGAPTPNLIRVSVVGTFAFLQMLRHHRSRGPVLARMTCFVFFSAALLLAASGCRSSFGAEQSDVVSGASFAGGSSPAIAGELPPVDDGRRVLIVYFTQGNATKRVAEDLAALLGADIERIVEKKARKWGFLGFMSAGAASSFSRATPIEPPIRDAAAYEAVVVCTPIWAWHMAPPVRSWLRMNKGKLPGIAAYVTVSGDTDPMKIVAAMAKESGRQPTVSAGFADRDFEDGNRTNYLDTIRDIVERFR
jgi:hypothetical protein